VAEQVDISTQLAIANELNCAFLMLNFLFVGAQDNDGNAKVPQAGYK
jgi:hypothetical protein